MFPVENRSGARNKIPLTSMAKSSRFRGQVHLNKCIADSHYPTISLFKPRAVNLHTAPEFKSEGFPFLHERTE